MDKAINALMYSQASGSLIDILMGRADICRWAHMTYNGATTSVVPAKSNPLQCSVVGGVTTLLPSLAGIDAKLQPLFPRTYRIAQCNAGSCAKWLCTFSSSSVTIPYPIVFPLVTPAYFGGFSVTTCSYTVFVTVKYFLEDCKGKCIFEWPLDPPFICEG